MKYTPNPEKSLAPIEELRKSALAKEWAKLSPEVKAAAKFDLRPNSYAGYSGCAPNWKALPGDTSFDDVVDAFWTDLDSVKRMNADVALELDVEGLMGVLLIQCFVGMGSESTLLLQGNGYSRSYSETDQLPSDGPQATFEIKDAKQPIADNLGPWWEILELNKGS